MVPALFAILILAAPALAQLTPDQRQSELRAVADAVSRKYALVDWKREGVKADPLDLRPWQARMAQAKDDLDFYEVLCEYMASFKDSHTAYFVPSTFIATLGFSVDIADDKVVIDAINRDLPYDDFVRQQIAGDELPDASEQTVIATGFLRLGAWNDEPNDPLEYKYERLDDLIHTTTTAFLGLTVRCARCHDHKFDPIRQRDYYALQASIFGYVETAVPLAPPAEAAAYLAAK